MLKQNRLIELEQELFKQKQSLKNNQKNKSKTFNYQNNTSDNNRLLQLEQELINQHKIKNEPPIKDNQEYQRMAKIVNNKSSANNKIFELQQSISKVNFSQKKSQKQNHKKSRNQKVQAMTFDYNEAIQLQYQDNSFAASLHYTKTELSNNNHNSTAFDLDNDISTIEVESFEVKEADDTNTQSVIPEVLPPTPQQETESQQIADVEAFEADIQAILDGTKLYDKPKQQNTNNTPSL
ncbi:MAG: hypothetical protein MJK14_24835, partial [Rivularia sp. ALOHA_DT_140]|nr:hypothetical protein [Rivularia sp. ALOHA_DT_140]